MSDTDFDAICYMYRKAHTEPAKTTAEIVDWALAEGVIGINEHWRLRMLCAAPALLAAMPTVPHPGGRLVKVVAHYADGSTQTIDGEVVTAAIQLAMK